MSAAGILIQIYEIVYEFQLEGALDVECAELSLLGNRDDNQDRVSVAIADDAALLIVIDGMGGHAEGGRAAEVAMTSILDSFWAEKHPVFDPQGFLHMSVARAHDDVVNIGDGISLETKPRATCAACLVQDGVAYWAHVGDSRVYLLRRGQVEERTRDHSHVEVLLREGLITEDEIHNHPMRNYVECCLGGDAALPEMSVSRRKSLREGDVVLLCTDGLWSGLTDRQIAALSGNGSAGLENSLEHLGKQAVEACAPYSDNTTIAALRWLG